jgi:hypothetical protein
MSTGPADSPEVLGRARNQTRNRSRHRRRKPVEIPGAEFEHDQAVVDVADRCRGDRECR